MTLKTNFWLVALLFMLLDAVIFGALLSLAMFLPLSTDAFGWAFGIVVIVSAALALALAMRLAPRLRARYWRRRDKTAKAVWR